MPLENQFNASPYFDDYSQEKDYYKVLFRPSVAIQTRELNQLQTILQNQIERFGNHVFKSGTIVSGVNFSYMPNYSYVKILDLQGDGQPVVPSGYVGLFARDALNLTARIVNSETGFESKAPDLNTLYLQYTNSSDPDTSNGNVSYTQFRVGETLTVFSKNYELFGVDVTNGGTGFSNSDTVVFQSALVVTGNTGAFANGEYIQQATTNAVAQIVQVNATAIPDSLVLKVRPRTSDLVNNSVNAAAWTFSSGYNIVANNGTTANVASLVGNSAVGIVTTDSLGIIISVNVTSGGSGFNVPPYVTVKTSNTTATVSSLNLGARNYKANVTVGNTTVNAVGTGYAFGVTEGIIYQKGFFLRVEPQVIVIDRYSTQPNNVSVGFTTTESTVDSNVDATLFDNAANTTNYSAPGAHRLKLIPTLVAGNTDVLASNTEFLVLAEWKEGQPYKENRTTQYSVIGEEFARRTRESSGDFVLDPFLVETREKATFGSNTFNVVIDPGTAYIQGKRVQTGFNNYLSVNKANTVESATDQVFTTNYGNYVLVKELGGSFDFNTASTVTLRSAAKSFLSSGSYSTSITAPGSQIGTARVRSIVLESGDHGSKNAVYRMYLFDIQMAAGKSFRNVRAIHRNDTTDGVADIVTVTDPTTGSTIAELYDTANSRLIFSVPGPTRSVTSTTYTYRTSDNSLQANTGGYISVGPLTTTGLSFPYTAGGTLSTTQEKEVVIIPLSTVDAAANLTGVASVTSGNTKVTGSGTTFTSELRVGDYVRFFSNSSVSTTGRVGSIANNTVLYLDAAASITNSVAVGIITFPASVPVSLEKRGTVTQSNTTAMEINLGVALATSMGVEVSYNVRSTPTSATSKTVNRDLFVKINTGTHAKTTVGPWSVGVPDIIRLKKVYLGNTSSNSTNLTPAQVGIEDITKYFRLDNGHTDDAYKVGSLVKVNNSGYDIPAGRQLLVQFDAFTSSGRTLFTVDSYNIDDTKTLAESNTSINTIELPEYVSSYGYRDVGNAIDFRPIAANTAAITTSANSATVNPSATFTLPAVDQLFPLPDAVVSYDVEYYVGRKDLVVVSGDNLFSVIEGTPARRPTPPKVPYGTISIGTLNVAPYPSLPALQSSSTIDIATKRINSSGVSAEKRANRLTTKPARNGTGADQPRGYTMRDIHKLEARIQALEYYTAFSLVEASVKAKNIPSSITPTLNRFKYGFFVDSFNDYFTSDTTSVEFCATINQEEGLLAPLTKSFNCVPLFDTNDATTAASITGKTLMLPYVEEVLIDQTIATSVVGSDGQKIQFAGSMTIDPPSFTIRVRGEATLVPDPVIYSGSGGGSGYQANYPGGIVQDGYGGYISTPNSGGYLSYGDPSYASSLDGGESYGTFSGPADDGSFEI